MSATAEQLQEAPHPRVLHLVLKQKWFNMIFHGIKREEYRDIKPFYNSRFIGKEYDVVCFRNGYNANAPEMMVEVNSITRDIGVPAWGAPAGRVWLLRLGKVLSSHNIKPCAHVGHDPQRDGPFCLLCGATV